MGQLAAWADLLQAMRGTLAMRDTLSMRYATVDYSSETLDAMAALVGGHSLYRSTSVVEYTNAATIVKHWHVSHPKHDLDALLFTSRHDSRENTSGTNPASCPLYSYFIRPCHISDPVIYLTPDCACR